MHEVVLAEISVLCLDAQRSRIRTCESKGFGAGNTCTFRLQRADAKQRPPNSLVDCQKADSRRATVLERYIEDEKQPLSELWLRLRLHHSDVHIRKGQ